MDSTISAVTPTCNNNNENENNNENDSENNSSTSPAKRSESQSELLSMGKNFLTKFGVICCGYFAGTFGFSISWLLIGVFVWVIRDKNAQRRESRENFHRAIREDEKKVITSALSDLPNWCIFPDTERAEWINKILRQLWPFVDEYVKTLIQNNIEPSIVSSLPDYLKSFRFEKVDLGNVPVRIGSVKAYDENTSRKQILLDLEIIYAGNCDIKVRMKGLKFGIKHLQLYGILRVELRPLIKDIPLVGCVSCYFLTNPAIEFNLTNVADILDIPGLSDLLRGAIKEQLSALMVLPNKLSFPLVNNLSMKTIKFVPPVGVVRIELIEAKNLQKKDVGVMGLGKSDPYCNIAVGAQEFKSPVIKNTIQPKWNYICHGVVNFFYGQNIEIEVMDEDQGSKDDFLGRTSLSLTKIANEGVVETWLKLKETKSGLIHLRATWLTLCDDKQHLQVQINECNQIKTKYESLLRAKEERGKDKESKRAEQGVAAVAIVLVFLDSARNLPSASKTSDEPSTYVILTIGKQKRLSNVKTINQNPIWEESFQFLVDQIEGADEPLRMEVWDSKANISLGDLSIKLSQILYAQNMTLSGPQMLLNGRSVNSEINVTAQIRILKSPDVSPRPKLLMETSVEEELNDTKTKHIPSLEEMVKATVDPIIETANIKDIIEISQEMTSVDEENKGSLNSNKNNIVVENNIYPRIYLTIKRNKTNINLTIHKAEKLPKIGDKLPDPYIKIYRKLDTSFKYLRKTSVRRSTRDPVYEKTYDFLLLANDGLQIDVITKISTSTLFSKKQRVLGIAKIDLADLDEICEISGWYDLEQFND